MKPLVYHTRDIAAYMVLAAFVVLCIVIRIIGSRLPFPLSL